MAIGIVWTRDDTVTTGREVSGDDDVDDRSALAEHHYGAHIHITIDVARVGKGTCKKRSLDKGRTRSDESRNGVREPHRLS
jgi:hypothetical protein